MAGPADAGRAAAEAVSGGRTFLVAVGDDRLLGALVDGLFDGERIRSEEILLGVVPAGRGSDFARTFGLPQDPVAACEHLSGPNTFPIDLGRITFAGSDGEAGIRHFANMAQLGLGGAIARRAERLPARLGRGRQFLGFWLTLAGFGSPEVSVDTGRQRFEGRAHNVIVANCQFASDGMLMSPRSWPGDGFLDVLVMKGPRSDAFTMLPRYARGEHVPHPNVLELRTRRVRIEADRPLWVEADGWPLGTTPATFEVVPRAVRLKI